MKTNPRENSLVETTKTASEGNSDERMKLTTFENGTEESQIFRNSFIVGRDHSTPFNSSPRKQFLCVEFEEYASNNHGSAHGQNIYQPLRPIFYYWEEKHFAMLPYDIMTSTLEVLVKG